MADRARSIVVGISPSRASARALRCAHGLSLALDLELRVVRVVGGERRLPTQGRVQEWCFARTGIALPASHVSVAVGDPAAELCGAAQRLAAEVIVLGSRTAPNDAGIGPLARTVIDKASCHVVVCGPAAPRS